jgi:hypothetical protein
MICKYLKIIVIINNKTNESTGIKTIQNKSNSMEYKIININDDSKDIW